MSDVERGVVLYKRWRLREGVTVDEVATLVKDRVIPHYCKLGVVAVLGLQTSDDMTVLTIQRWPDRAALDAAMSGDRFAEWWREYEPILAAWDAATEFEEEWQSEILVG